ncbi:OmpW family outer membrane protein [Ningiella sp. W23]|uniref:OmpW family outer membrane protein n=1 Tax=Ningiella sp. W23 TaxID=3023715 RepID=UPI0037577F58
MKKSLVTLAVLSTFAVTTGSAFAYEKGDIVVRAGLASVVPGDSTSNVIAGPDDLGFGLTVDNNAQLGLNFAYFLTDRINVEVLAATPFKHDVNFGVEDPLGSGTQLGEVTHLPPTVSVNYYLTGADATFQPYVGVGVNYTIFFDEEFTSANEGAGLSDLELDDSFGLAFQIGADLQMDEHWHVNASIRYIDIDTDASFSVGGADVGRVNEINIDPKVFSITVGYTF